MKSLGACTAGGFNDRSVEVGRSEFVVDGACFDAEVLDMAMLSVVVVLETDVAVTGGMNKHEHALDIRYDKGVLTAVFVSATSRAGN